MEKDFNDKILGYLLIFTLFLVLITLIFAVIKLTNTSDEVRGVVSDVVTYILKSKDLLL